MRAQPLWKKGRYRKDGSILPQGAQPHGAVKKGKRKKTREAKKAEKQKRMGEDAKKDSSRPVIGYEERRKGAACKATRKPPTWRR